jgi:hypothetical protein
MKKRKSIKLQAPYTDKWKYGSLGEKRDKNGQSGRMTLALRDGNGKSGSVQWARYKMAVKLGRYLKPEEEVDHIDNDHSNNDISNLQLITPKNNKKKQREIKNPKSHKEILEFVESLVNKFR